MFSLNQVDIGNFPLVVAEMFGISEFAGGIFVTILVLIVVEAPLLLWSKRVGMLHLLVAFLVVCFGVAVAWLDSWFVFMLSLYRFLL